MNWTNWTVLKIPLFFKINISLEPITINLWRELKTKLSGSPTMYNICGFHFFYIFSKDACPSASKGRGRTSASCLFDTYADDVDESIPNVNDGGFNVAWLKTIFVFLLEAGRWYRWRDWVCCTCPEISVTLNRVTETYFDTTPPVVNLCFWFSHLYGLENGQNRLFIKKMIA